MSTVTFIGPDALLGKDAPFGSFSYQALLGGAESLLDDAGNFVMPVNNITPLNMTIIGQFMGAGGVVNDLPVFIKMGAIKYAGEVPSGISNSQYNTGTDEEPNIITRTWAEWKDATHKHMDAEDGDKVVPGNSYGTELTTPELLVLLADSDYSLYLPHELDAILPQPEGDV